MKSLYQRLFQNLRSYSGLSTATDHQLVKTNINLEWWKLNEHFKKSQILDVDKLRKPETSLIYRDSLVTKLVEEKQENEIPGNTWKQISKVCKKTAE